jgi:KaiC/GvpD/RAD55 family RecA-like ATPase
MADQLAQTLRRQGPSVPTGWRRFDDVVSLHPKTLVNVFSAPGVGKSMWALNLAYRVKVPVLYVTIDTPLRTQAIRWWSLLSGTHISAVEGNPRIAMRRANRMVNGSHVEWCDTPVSIDELPSLVGAVTEYWGERPRIIVADVIGDLLPERSFEAFTSAFGAMKTIAHRYRATAITLHHATKNIDPEATLYLRDVEYAGDKQPDIVIGMHTFGKRTVVAEILKNRLGEASPDGSVTVRFKVNFSRARVEEW